MFRSYNTIQAHPINQGEPKLFYGLSNITGCFVREHPAWFASNESYRSSFLFLNREFIRQYHQQEGNSSREEREERPNHR